MKLAHLLEHHRKATGPKDLSDNLGDGFLVKKNTIYSRIRSETLKVGFTYSSRPHAGYEALPFAQLEDILASKVIPYTDNVSVIEKLVSNLKDDVVWDDVQDGLKKNYVFHESCHAVARAFTPGRDGKAFRMMMEESFANTCELLSVADADDSSHRIFLELNSYAALFEEKGNLKNALSQIGFAKVFGVLWLSYLFSNHLHERLDDRDFNGVLKAAGADSLPAAQIKALRALSKIAFTLDLRFRLVTTGFHLKLNGVRMSTDEIARVDILKSPGLPEFLNSAIKAVSP